MIHSIVTVIEVVSVVGAISSCGYYLLCLWSAASFLRERKLAGASQNLPPVSILKPLKGIDPQIFESFRSHCLQDYSEYEIIFGVSDADDPALASVEKLQQEFPRQQIRLIVCAERLGTNVKVSNLAQMLAEAKYEYLIVNDSDIRVERNYLQRVISPLLDLKVGMVTCLYRGIAASTLGSRLEALGISTDFSPGVLTARLLEGGIHFGLGSTLAFRRSDLAKIGGFESLLDYLADDYELGKRISDLGLEIKFSQAVVETYLPPYNLSGFFAHQLRWARGVRDSRAGGYFGLVFTFGLLWSMVALLAARGAVWSGELFALTFFLRLLVAWIVGWIVLRDRQVSNYVWLIPLRDLVGAVVWLVSFWGHTVVWRGERFRLKKGRMSRVE
jgi:ceramide glucosyltransferase